MIEWAKNIKDPVFSFASKCNRMNFNAIISLFLSNRTRVNNVYQGLSSLTLIRMLFAVISLGIWIGRTSYMNWQSKACAWSSPLDISHHKHNNMIYDGYCTFSCHIPIVPLWIWNGNKRFNLKRTFKKSKQVWKRWRFWSENTHCLLLTWFIFNVSIVIHDKCSDIRQLQSSIKHFISFVFINKIHNLLIIPSLTGLISLLINKE